MARKSNSWVVILAVVVAAAAVVVYKQQDKPASVERSQPAELLADLKVEDIDQVRIDGAETSVTLRKLSAESWGLSSRNDYPIDAEQLREIVMTIVNVKAIDQLTRDPEKYEALGVDEHPEKALVRLLDKSGGELGAFYLGKDRESSEEQPMPGGFPGGGNYPQGQFFRVAGDPAVYVSKDVMSITTEPTGWLMKEITRVEESGLQRITIENPATTESLSLTREKTDPFKLEAPIPEGYQAKAGATSSVSRALANLDLKDVIPADDPKAASLEPGPVFRATQKNGLTYVVNTGKLDGKYYVRLSAEYQQGQDLGLSDQVTSDTQAAKALPPAAEEVEKFNARHAPWIYEIQEYSYNNLAKKFSELIEPLKKDEPEKMPGAMPTLPGAAQFPPGAAQFLTQPPASP